MFIIFLLHCCLFINVEVDELSISREFVNTNIDDLSNE